MKIALQYLSDQHGKPQAIQMPIDQWEKILLQIKKAEQILRLSSDLKMAFTQVDALRKSKAKKHILTDFLQKS